VGSIPTFGITTKLRACSSNGALSAERVIFDPLQWVIALTSVVIFCAPG
jgi:hypothetical protein